MMYLALTLLVVLISLLVYMFLGGPKLPPETDAIIDEVLSSDLPEIITGQTGYATSNGLQIWYERISPDGPSNGTVLLIMGNGGDALEWPPQFVRAFVDEGYHVIRYDHRDTGMSDWVEEWDRKNPYSTAEMADDAIAVLDALDVQKAHLVGLSMGGIIAQEIASTTPERVSSMTLMSTSGYVGDPELPGLTSHYFFESAIKGIPLLKYRLMGGEKNLIKERIAKTISVAGRDGLDVREVAEVVLYNLRERRGVHIWGALHHLAAVSASGSRYEQLQTAGLPTLVIHGTADRILPIEHGKKLVEVIPNANGLWLDGVGHVFPYPNMDRVTEQIFSHISMTSESSEQTSS